MRVSYSEILPPFSALLYFGTVERHRLFDRLKKTLSLGQASPIKSIISRIVNKNIHFKNTRV